MHNIVHNIDCMEFMRTLPDSAFDLAICDPPYGIGETWSKSKRDRFYHKGKLFEYKNKSIPDAKYFSELLRVSKNQVIWGGNYMTDFLPPTNAWIFWDKQRQKNSVMSEGELAWTSFSSVLRIVRLQWAGCMKCEDVKKIHPHQKPVALYKWVLKKYAKPGWRILDTHVGSGSSREGCYDLGFDFEGCEIDHDYWLIQEDRFRKHIDPVYRYNESIKADLQYGQPNLFQENQHAEV